MWLVLGTAVAPLFVVTLPREIAEVIDAGSELLGTIVMLSAEPSSKLLVRAPSQRRCRAQVSKGTHVYIAQSNNRREGIEPCAAVMTSEWSLLSSPVLLKAVTLYSNSLAVGRGTCS